MTPGRESAVWTRSLIVAATLLSGCATMDAGECRGANWYDLGFRDGLYGLQRMDVVYDEQCGKHGVKLDAGAYAKGWQEGRWENESRRRRGGA
jgi:hypothetical protein